MAKLTRRKNVKRGLAPAGSARNDARSSEIKSGATHDRSGVSPNISRPQLLTGRVRPFAARTPPARAPAPQETVVSFDRLELREILNLYGRKVAAGEWRDYALDFTAQKAVFSVYSRASECALYEIEKPPG